jgi:hypothetical protein
VPKGSHVTWSATGWEPRVCLLCGKRVTLTQSAYHGGALQRPFSIHATCGGYRDTPTADPDHDEALNW